MKKIFISAGEQSGDLHGSNLIRGILKKDPDLKIYGLGSHKMVEEGMTCLHDMTHKSVMWVQAASKIHEFLQILRDCSSFFKNERPSLAILIDYCGLNFYIAKAAKKYGIAVMYYVSPQLWAHGNWRVKKVKKLVDKMVVIFPFEEKLYRDAGINARYVGNPIIDEITKQQEYEEGSITKLKNDCNGNIISLFPGSRKQEIKRFLPILLKTAEHIYSMDSSVRFLVSCAGNRHRESIESMVNSSCVPATITSDNLAEVINSSKLCLTSSGTITLKIAYYLTPMIIIYKISWLAYFIAKPFRQSPYLSLVNRLAEKFIVPERLMYRNDYKWLFTNSMELLNNNEVRSACIRELQKIKGMISEKTNVSDRAAEEAVCMIK